MIAAAWCIAGLIALIIGAELLVRSGTRLATLLGVSPMVIGLTVVSVGTSFPELVVGIGAARLGSGSLAVGNIAGTNTFNILFILGMSALLIPLTLEPRSIRIDLPVMILAALTMLVMAMDGLLTRFEGMILLAAAVAYNVAIVRGARLASRAAATGTIDPATTGPERRASDHVLRHSVLLILGIAVIVLGGDWLVKGASEGARQLEVSEAFIGLSVVAIGTSSPELATTIVSTLRGHRDIAIGNLIGSSVNNVLLILGATVLVTPAGIAIDPELIRVDIPVMVAVALVCAPVFMSGRRVSRLEGGLFVGAYAAYFIYLIVART